MQHDCFPDAVGEWPKTPISALAEQNPRYPVKKGIEYPFLEMAAVGENFGGILKWDSRRLEGSGLARFKLDDTLFAKITPCPENGKIAMVSGMPGETGLGSTEFIVLSPREEADPRFLFHLLCSHDVRGRATARMEGSTGRQRIPEDVFDRRLLVPKPNVDEQSAIARVLDAVDAAVDRAREAASQASELKRAIAQKLFSTGTRGEPQRKTPVGYIPKSWEVRPVSGVVTNFEYGLSLPMHLKGHTPILRMGNIQRGDVVMDGLKYVTLPQALLDRYLLKRGDVLFNRTNSQEWVGKVGIYRTDDPAVFASYLIRLHADTELVDNYYLGQLLSSHDAQCRIKRFATPGVQQVNINAKNLGKVLIPIPVGKTGLDEQREIAALLEAADERVRSHAPVIAALEELKKSLTHDLLTGRVRVDPTLFKQEVAA
ncbi:restriction endonuclease subunit S [Luteimonas granuli]|uniref:Type I restriction modification DNA specificity domain-containing protein n=1 Tax=Luteimonas granuli TaxID=1176533 RepID=A0A518N5K9_9GAMM|nr:restriction endonuclease subunit S [Luteimonas granuli]QDW67205.1 hypothetical protein FPZ22_10165 [Luteimonas granuli]